MASVKYSLSKKQPQEGRLEVLVRFSAGHPYDFNARTQIYVPVDRWDAAAGTLTFNTRFVTPQVQELITLRNRLEDLRRWLLTAYMADTSAAVSRDWLVSQISRFHHPEALEACTPLASLFPQYIAAAGLAPGTARQYAVIQRIVERFGEAESVLYAETMTSADLEALAAFMAKEVRVRRGRGSVAVERGQNTISSKFKKLRAVCMWAHKRNLMPANPFAGYTIPAEHYGSVIALTLEERDRVAACQGLTPALEQQRDIFVFQCHVGCRVSDLRTFTHASIQEEGGIFVLQYIQVKLRKSRPVTLRVPLDEVALALVRKYAAADPVRLFPFISDVKYNIAIKEVLRQAGIYRRVLVQDAKTLEAVSRPLYEVASSHLARRTFAYNLFKATGSERIVSSMTGHAPGSAAFCRYSEVDDEMKAGVLAGLGTKKPGTPKSPL